MIDKENGIPYYRSYRSDLTKISVEWPGSAETEGVSMASKQIAKA
jgi:hypothetical protein